MSRPRSTAPDRERRRKFVAWAAAVVLVCALGASSPVLEELSSPNQTVEAADGWTIERLRAMPEPVSSLRYDPESERLYVGTSGSASIYRLSLHCVEGVPFAIASSLSDGGVFGVASVSNLDLIDVDGDGRQEHIARNSQSTPRGRPRIYAFSAEAWPVPIAFVRLAIDSSWTHGLATVGDERPSLLIACCGHGELVEMRLESSPPAFAGAAPFSGFVCRTVMELPASGEQIVAEGPSEDLWPVETQTAVADLDSAGGKQVYI